MDLYTIYFALLPGDISVHISGYGSIYVSGKRLERDWMINSGLTYDVRSDVRLVR